MASNSGIQNNDNQRDFMIKPFVTLGVSALLLGCTFGHVSSIPMEIEGIGKVYRYEGRANFSHQLEKADEMMASTCEEKNGGYPVIVDLQQKDLGVVVFGTGQSSTNFSGNAYGNAVYGNASTSSTGSLNAMRNQNQAVLFRCEATLDN
ncbi:hypothetical protein [Marinobacter salarius]|uniref:hypothetical protein n=1 Tax=Marinobacter salarius TaxID=1420917 RepID=UPI000F8571E0|nr:hypothetical protein [Marinobacter salarius]AZR42999.1 hypothetical protein MTMN5_03566 [Marinobacter salarius]